jgi:hypothetical protein
MLSQQTGYMPVRAHPSLQPQKSALLPLYSGKDDLSSVSEQQKGNEKSRSSSLNANNRDAYTTEGRRAFG